MILKHALNVSIGSGAISAESVSVEGTVVAEASGTVRDAAAPIAQTAKLPT